MWALTQPSTLAFLQSTTHIAARMTAEKCKLHITLLLKILPRLTNIPKTNFPILSTPPILLHCCPHLPWSSHTGLLAVLHILQAHSCLGVLALAVTFHLDSGELQGSCLPITQGFVQMLLPGRGLPGSLHLIWHPLPNPEHLSRPVILTAYCLLLLHEDKDFVVVTTVSPLPNLMPSTAGGTL